MFLIGNLIAIYYLSLFFRDQIYYAYFPERDPAMLNYLAPKDDINMEKFDSLIENIQKKSVKTDFSQTTNLFD